MQHEDREAHRVHKQLARFAALDEADIDEVARVLLSTDKGQKFLWWLLQIGKVGLQPFTEDPHRTAFQCGELNVGNQLLARLISVNAEGYADLLKKRKAEDERRTELATRVSRGDDLFGEPDDAAGASDTAEPS